MISQETIVALIDRATHARENAYAPYSHFKVGAAVLCDNGDIFTGANVENASYGLTICAERAAIFAAIAAGCHKIVAIAIAADVIAYPCGACRQVLAEFADADATIVMHDISRGETRHTILDALLPHSFKLEVQR